MPAPMPPSPVVDTDWLAANIENERLRVIEVDTDPGRFDLGRLPHSVFWPAMSLLDDGMRTLSDPGLLSRKFGDAGVDPDTTVVAVHGQYRATSGWLYWFMKRIGHRRVCVLDGGREKWVAEGRSLETVAADVEPTRYPSPVMDASASATFDDAKSAIDQPDTVLLDVRTPAEYSGEVYLQAPPKPGEIAGHIPGATHLSYEAVHNDDGTFKSVEELKELFERHGVTENKAILPYCAVGARSAHIWFALTQLLGYPNVRNYHGSWREWSTVPGAPVARELS
ncbi:MAG: sulfurtransferase [Pseudomonadota bacterium]